MVVPPLQYFWSSDSMSYILSPAGVFLCVKQEAAHSEKSLVRRIPTGFLKPFVDNFQMQKSGDKTYLQAKSNPHLVFPWPGTNINASLTFLPMDPSYKHFLNQINQLQESAFPRGTIKIIYQCAILFYHFYQVRSEKIKPHRRRDGLTGQQARHRWDENWLFFRQFA